MILMDKEHSTETPETKEFTYKLLCKSGETKVLVYRTATTDVTELKEEIRQTINNFITNN